MNNKFKLNSIVMYIPMILLLLFLAFSISCDSGEEEQNLQGSLEGRVTDANNGEPVNDATVSLTGAEQRSETVGGDGLYSFENLLVGTYTIQVVHPQYETNSLEVTLRPIETSEGDIALQPLRQIEIDPIQFEFGDITTNMNLSLKNLGSEDVEFKISSNENWLSVDKANVLVASNNEQIVKVTINRILLDYGNSTTDLLVNVPGKDTQKLPVTVRKNNVNKAVLTVEQGFINFGSTNTSFDLVIRNTGQNLLEWELTTDQSWLSANNISGSLEAGASKVIKVLCDRSSLENDVYEGSLLIQSNGGEKKIGVSTEVIKNIGIPVDIVVPVGLRTYYTFNSGAGEDEVENYAIFDANAYLVTDSTSLDGYFVNFEGNGTFIELEGNPLFNSSPGVVHGTVSLWLRSSVGGALVSVPYESTKLYNEFMAGFSNEAFVHSISNSSGRACCFDTYGNFTVNPGSFLLDFNWHHLVIVYKGDTEETILYVDGVEIAKSFYEFYPYLSRAMDANFLKIGSDYNAGSINPGIFDFQGHMDNIRIYNRPLSDSEIKEIYEAER